jgi:hypothetical protein
MSHYFSLSPYLSILVTNHFTLSVYYILISCLETETNQ